MLIDAVSYSLDIGSPNEENMQQSDDHQPAKQSADEEDVDVEKMFIDGRVQRLLKNLIGMDIDKIYSDRVVSSVERKHYALMTDDMITHIRTKMMRRGERFQQFVPVKEPRSSIPTVLANEEGWMDSTTQSMCSLTLLLMPQAGTESSWFVSEWDLEKCNA
uniref:Uncharacterized protein n=1 Tax=Ditylenchus dipsaci TaxID=166011 RepID=A0A915E3N5_9BILA